MAQMKKYRCFCRKMIFQISTLLKNHLFGLRTPSGGACRYFFPFLLQNLKQIVLILRFSDFALTVKFLSKILVGIEVWTLRRLIHYPNSFMWTPICNIMRYVFWVIFLLLYQPTRHVLLCKR
jgi:hypothetical protein